MLCCGFLLPECLSQEISSSISHCLTCFVFGKEYTSILAYHCSKVSVVYLCSYVKFFPHLATFIHKYFFSLRMQIMFKDVGCVVEHEVL